MKFTDYMKIRNTNPKSKNSLSTGEASILGIDVTVKGWMNKDINLTDSQVERAVDFALKSKFVRQGVKNNLRPFYMKSFDGMDLQYVYLMENELGMLKIGISSNPIKRARTLSTGSGLIVNIICYWQIANPARTTEAKLHKLFKAYKISGEWFKSGSFTKEDIESNFNFAFNRKDFD